MSIFKDYRALLIGGAILAVCDHFYLLNTSTIMYILGLLLGWHAGYDRGWKRMRVAIHKCIEGYEEESDQIEEES